MSEEITKDTETTDEVVKTVPYERFKLVNEERKEKSINATNKSSYSNKITFTEWTQNF